MRREQSMDELSINTIRTLSMDAVQQANLGIFGALSVNKNVKYDNIDALTKQVLGIFGSREGSLRQRRSGIPVDRDDRVLAHHQ